VGKRGDKRRKRKRDRRQERRVPYEGLQVGPLKLERYGRKMMMSVDSASPDFAAFQEATREAIEQLPAAQVAGTKQLEELVSALDPFDVVAASWMSNSLVDPETYREWEHSGLASAVELLAAIVVKQPGRAGPFRPPLDAGRMDAIEEGTRSLLQMGALRAMAEESPPGSERDPYAEVRATARSHRLAVRGASYDWQERRTVEELFEDARTRDDVRSACGFLASSALQLEEGVGDLALERLATRAADARAFADNLVADLHRSRTGVEVEGTSGELLEVLADLDTSAAEQEIHRRAMIWAGYAIGDTLSFSAAALSAHTGVDEAEVDAYLGMFSIRLGESTDSGRPIGIEDVRERPLLRDEQDLYLCVSAPSLLWAIRPRIERALKERDQKAFERYERHRAKVVEERAIAAFETALRPDWAYGSLAYDVQDTGASNEAELDGLIRLDSALILVEAKASSMRPSARRLAPDSFRDWLKKEVSAAAKQVRRARDSLLGTERPAIRDANGRPLDVDLEGIEDSFECVVVLEDLSAVAPSTWQLADAGVLPQEPVPLLVSLHDLEVIADVVERPAELIHYLLRRRRLDQLRSAWAPDELDYFMHYLLFGLFWHAGEDGQPHPPEMLLSHTEELDSWYLHVHGRRESHAKRPGPNHHKSVAELLDCLDQHRSPGWLNASLALLELEPKARRKIAASIEELRNRSRLDGKWHDATLVSETFGMTVMTCPPQEAREIEKRLSAYCLLKKYQHRAGLWVGFAGWAGPPDPAQAVFVARHPWEEDDALAAAVATLPSASTGGSFDARIEERRARRRSRPKKS
jgi:hypothetical protein